MGFFAKLFGKDKDEQAAEPMMSVAEENMGGGHENIVDNTMNEHTAPAAVSEAQEQMNRSTEEAQSAMHEAAANTPAADTVDETIDSERSHG